jgi:hypothetical protein
MTEKRERPKSAATAAKSPPAPAGDPWTTDVWGRSRRFAGHIRYQCKLCPRDTLDADEIREHVQQAHGLLLDDNATPQE